MKHVLEHISDGLERQLGALVGAPRTQATDAMIGSAIRLKEIIDGALDKVPEGDIQAMISKEVSKQLESLTGGTPPKKSATTKSKTSTDKGAKTP